MSHAAAPGGIIMPCNCPKCREGLYLSDPTAWYTDAEWAWEHGFEYLDNESEWEFENRMDVYRRGYAWFSEKFDDDINWINGLPAPDGWPYPFNANEFLDEVSLDPDSEPMFVLDKDRRRQARRYKNYVTIKRRLHQLQAMTYRPKQWWGHDGKTRGCWFDAVYDSKLGRLFNEMPWQQMDEYNERLSEPWNAGTLYYKRDYRKVDWEAAMWDEPEPMPEPDPEEPVTMADLAEMRERLDAAKTRIEELYAQCDKEVMLDTHKAQVARRKEVNAYKKNREYPYRYEGHKLYLEKVRDYKIARQSPDMEVA